MSAERDEEINEIAAYYESSGADGPADEQPETQSDIKPDNPPAEPAGTPSDEAETAAEKSAEPEDNNRTADTAKKNSANPYIVTAIISAFVVIFGFAAGLTVLPYPQKAADDAVTKALKSDADYTAAYNENEDLKKEIDALNSDNERIETAFNDVVEYEKQLDELNAEFQTLNDELYNARGELKSAEEEYNNVQTALSELHSRPVTLPPGTYTAGIHIPSGTYLITGNGSLLTAGADKTLKVNINLDASTPYRCTLADNDTIKLSTEALFNPEEG